MPMFARVIAAVAIVLAYGRAGTAQAQWIGSWTASPAPPQVAAPNVRPDRVAPLLEDQTIVQIVRLSAGGSALRIRLTNEYGQTPLVIGAARVGVVHEDGSTGPVATVTFAGATSFAVPAGAPAVSDPVKLKTAAFDRLRIAVYVRNRPACTCHMVGLEPLELSSNGNYTDKPFVSVAPQIATYRAFLSEVDVERDDRVPVIVALGDSVTDGVGSTLGANHRWPDRLAERLAARSGIPVAVLDAGIAGNQLLSDGAAFGGQNALARLDRDVLSVPGVTHLIILEGINDVLVGGESPPTSEALIGGYRQIIARAHARGIKVIGGTMTPSGRGKFALSLEGQAVVRKVNEWIRVGGSFDGVVDFDAALRDPKAPDQIRANLRTEDGLHPNDAGYRAMADAIDLYLFR
jgi:lysophospholipase L1-like esterase